MFYYAHSINTLNSLNEIDFDTGIEMDIRDEDGKIVLGHDPMQKDYSDIEPFLKELKGRAVIANIKSERVEEKFFSLLKEFSPKSNYFFLDSSFSMIIKYGKRLSFASRFSEYESLETSINLIRNGLINWIWVDTFYNFPINKKNFKVFNSLKANTCLTSPDLLGRPEDIKTYANLIKNYNVKFNAICCKKNNIKIWDKYLKE